MKQAPGSYISVKGREYCLAYVLKYLPSVLIHANYMLLLLSSPIHFLKSTRILTIKL